MAVDQVQGGEGEGALEGEVEARGEVEVEVEALVEAAPHHHSGDGNKMGGRGPGGARTTFRGAGMLPGLPTASRIATAGKRRLLLPLSRRQWT